MYERVLVGSLLTTDEKIYVYMTYIQRSVVYNQIYIYIRNGVCVLCCV